MSQQIIREVEQQYLKAARPKFDVGDTVSVHIRIQEGGKERVQAFVGTVLGRRGAGINEKFTVRRIVAGEGVERIFPLHSPAIAKIEVVRSGVSRRAKLYFLRQRVGKATRLKERRPPRKALVVAGEETIAEREAREAADEARIRAAEKAKRETEAAKKQAKLAEKAGKAEKAQKADQAQPEKPAEPKAPATGGR